MKTFISTLFLFLFWHLAMAQPTTLLVRAKAKDAKFIGSSIGGARIIVREAASGKILADGFTEGSTGNTQRIIQDPPSRRKQLSEPGTAVFRATLDIEEPTFITVEGYAPWNKPQARIKTETQLWLIPGKDITGDGLVLEFPGFIVDVLSPQTHERISAGSAVPLTANVVMMCGCPLTEGGLWDANQYEVLALIQKDGKALTSVPLHISEKASTFVGSLQAQEAGLYQATIYAYDPQSGNTGVGIINFIVK